MCATNSVQVVEVLAVSVNSLVALVMNILENKCYMQNNFFVYVYVPSAFFISYYLLHLVQKN